MVKEMTTFRQTVVLYFYIDFADLSNNKRFMHNLDLALVYKEPVKPFRALFFFFFFQFIHWTIFIMNQRTKC